MSNKETDGVLVVGAGPVGLTLAILLLIQRIPTRIIDEKDQFTTSSRGTATQCRQLELLQFLGVVEDVLKLSTPPHSMRIYDQDGKSVLKEFVWSQPVEENPSIPYIDLVTISQANLEAALRSRLRALGGTIEMSTSLTSLNQEDGYVTAETVFKSTSDGSQTKLTRDYTFVVAADGAKGRVRRMVGVEYVGESHSDRMFIADVTAHNIDDKHWHRWGNVGSLAVFLKPLVPYPRFQLQSIGPDLPSTLPKNVKELQEYFNAVSNRDDILLDDMSWSTEWRANIRMAKVFATGNVYFVGDSAHCHSPAGGQGITTGMMDSFNLAWKLALSYRNLSPLTPSSPLLSSYSTERIPVVAEMLNLSNLIHELTIGNHTKFVVDAKQEAEKDPMYRSKTLSQLWVNYRWSDVVLDERFVSSDGEGGVVINPFGVEGAEGMVRAGDRAPEAIMLREIPVRGRDHQGTSTAAKTQTTTTSLFEHYSPTVHTLLVFPGTDSSIPSDIDEYVKPYRDLGLITVWIILSPGHADPSLVDGIEVEVEKMFVDVEGFARKAYGLPVVSEVYVGSSPRSWYVLLRPDGMIGACGSELGIVKRYFDRILRS